MGKKSEKAENAAQSTSPIPEALEKINSKEDLKHFLSMIVEKMDMEQAAPVYILTLMNHIMTQPNIYELLDEDNKEMARAIWLRMKQQGMQLRNPPMLFGEEGA
ncbi:MAG: hypothetical protein GYA55_09995 [SAR324 cluster bacterium]|uniref:Uncharacterized protein n=1 Tax=SAR324 cluster bacterium TaxID=2024889 RepID=A0A7X9FSF6_9DELT|nr:hypothetical protein [SAR324 cluster bacterium]